MTIVFTAILGDCDSLKPAPKGADRCVCFVDDVAKHPDPKGWELWPVDLSSGEDTRRTAWFIRATPHHQFSEYDRVVWIDASFTLTDLPRLLADSGDAPIAALRHHRRSSPYAEAKELVKVGQARKADIDAQVRAYGRYGFTPTHLSISCVIVRDRSETARKFSETWAHEIRTHLGDNTQVSLDYAAWKAGTSIKALRGTRHQNPYSTHDHEDHKQRRKPYLVPA